jgi:cell filamentation protein
MTRTVRITKGHTVFAYPEHIEAEAARLFGALNKHLATGTMTLDLAADLFGEINVIHPFREGNGRTQRIIFAGVLGRMGYDADYTGIRPDEMIAAMVAAYNGACGPVRQLFQRIARDP